jgi:hypothetical protein
MPKLMVSPAHWGHVPGFIGASGTAADDMARIGWSTSTADCARLRPNLFEKGFVYLSFWLGNHRTLLPLYQHSAYCPWMEKIRVTCDTKLNIPLDELHEIQDDLKTMTAERYSKFSSLVQKKGIWFASHVWKEKIKKGAHRWCIVDGTGRKRMFVEMRQRGFQIPKIPCVEIQAENLKEAKEAVLAASSSFHTMTHEGLHGFLEAGHFSIEDLDAFEFPEIDLPEFKIEFYPDPILPAPQGAPETVTFDAYQNAAIKQIVLYFPKEQYQKVIEGFDSLLRKWKLEDHSQVVWRLVDEANRATPKKN